MNFPSLSLVYSNNSNVLTYFVRSCVPFFLVWTALAVPSWASAQTLVTLWPLLDYRASESDYRSLHLLGPLFKYESKGPETEFSLRPLIFRASDEKGDSLTEILYPLAVRRRTDQTSSTSLLGLLSLENGQRDMHGVHLRRFFLFPLLFYGEHSEQGSYAAVFPLGGRLHGWFGRDRITFALFPLYSRTERGKRRVDNILWPFFARISGPTESGYKFWPWYGWSAKTSDERKSFFLWPFGFTETRGPRSENPGSEQAVLPFYYHRESAGESYRSVLWPFFNYRDDRVKGYREWTLPWPLVRIMRGESHYGYRFLPLYADETLEVTRRRWYLWPLVRIDGLHSALIQRREHRILFFLYRHLSENKTEAGTERKRILFWPLFGYNRFNGVSHVHALALLEPVLPDNEGIERSWAPLWRFYQQKWDTRGNQVGSLMWNLVWWERREDALAWELFPLVDYRRTRAADVDVHLFKGLLAYRSVQGEKSLSFFFLPWRLTWHSGVY